MFDIGWSELLVIAVVAIVVVGPKDLPPLLRTFGKYVGKARRMAADFQDQFEQAVRESELEEVRKTMESVRDAKPPVDLKADITPPLMLPKHDRAAPADRSKSDLASAMTVGDKPKPKRSSTKARKAPAKRSKTKAKAGELPITETEPVGPQPAASAKPRKARARKQP